MGKEWLLYWWVGGNGGTSKSTKKRKSVGGRGSSTERESGPPAGCMCSVFQLFDLHHFQFPLNHHQTTLKTDHSFLHFQDHEPSSVTKGVEAPRNSLELLETAACLSLSSSSAIKEEKEILNIPVGIQIRTNCENRSPRASTSSSKARGEDVYSECGSSNSPGAKTPNLVARLMGLDLLPETAGSPSLSSSSSLRRSSITNPRHRLKSEGDGGSVSLPETPRISLARRSDVEQSRLSLQISREHVVVEELEYSAKKKTRNSRRIIMQDENTSPGGNSYHARNIVQQVKERVSRSRNRKVGLDITNTLKSRDQRRDENLILLKPSKKTSPLVLATRTEDHDSSNSKQTTPSCSPRIRLFLEPKNKTITSSTSTSPRLSPLSVFAEKQSKVQEEANTVLPQKVKLRPGPDDQQKQHMYKYKSVQKICKKAGNERFNSRLICIKKEEPFIRSPAANKLELAVSSTAVSEKKKCKKKTTPLSNEILPVTVTRKDSYLFPLTKLREQQVSDADALPCTTTTTTTSMTRLPSSASRSYCPKELTHTSLTYQENINRHKRMCNGAASNSNSSSVDEMEFQYVKRILQRTGLDNGTPVTLAKWFSPTHPLDPSIFHYMELFHPAATATATKVSRLSEQRSNRKLMFQLVDEILVEILKPYINPNPYGRGQRLLYGSELIEEVCRRMKNFPSANCQVLEDIDALIERDLKKSKTTSYEEEEEEKVRERITLEIEREIMEALLHETSTTLLS